MPDPLYVPCKALVVEVVTFAWFTGDLCTTACGVLQCIQLADHHFEIGLFGGRCSSGMRKVQAAKECDQARPGKAVSQGGEGLILVHGWALVIPVGRQLAAYNQGPAARNPLSARLGFLLIESQALSTRDWTLEEHQKTHWQRHAIRPSLSVLVAELDLTFDHGLDADQLPPLAAQL